MEDKVCLYCKTDFIRTVRGRQEYCTPTCRKKAAQIRDKDGIRNWHRKNPAGRILRAIKFRAEQKGLDFDLTKEDIILPTHCPVLGLELEPRYGQHGGQDCSPSVDRIDNTRGYVKGNIQIISRLANAMKSSASPEQLLKFADWIKEVYA